MSALVRCSRFSRVFLRSATCKGRFSIETKSNGKNAYCIQSQLPGISVCPFHKTDKYIGRPFSTQVKKTENATFTFPENYPASEYWKKFDFQGRRLLGSSSFDQCCKAVDMRTRTGESINAAEFHYFMKLVAEEDMLTASDASTVLRSCVCKDLNNADGIAWTEYMLNRFTSLGVDMTAMHYKIVLHNYHITDHQYSPTEFLSQMEKQKVVPDGAILGRFIQTYCKIGDMNSASKILEHMKQSEIAISLPVYNSLIMGHFIAGDHETAMRLFKDVKKIGFELEQSSFSAAIIGQAYRNDMEAVKELFVQAQEENVLFTPTAYSSLIEKVAAKGLTEYFDYFLSLLKANTTRYFNQANQTLKVLLSQGNYEFACRYFEGLDSPSARIFYKAAITSEVPVEEIVKYSRFMKKQGHNQSDLAEFLGVAIQRWEFERGAALLSYIEKEGEEMRPQYLWPFICHYRTMNNLEGLKHILPFCFADRMTVEDFLNPTLIELGVGLEDYPQLIKDHCTRFTVEERNTCELQMILHTQGTQAALEAVDRFDKLASIGGHDGSMLVDGLRPILENDPKSWRTILQLITAISSKSSCNYSWMIYRIANSMTVSGESLDELKNCLLELGCKTTKSELTNTGLLDLLSEEEHERLIEKDNFYKREDLQNMTTEEIFQIRNRNLFLTTYLLNRLWYEKETSAFEKGLADIDLRVLKNIELLRNMSTFYFYIKNDPMMAGQCLLKWKTSRYGDPLLIRVNRTVNFHLVYNTATELAKLGHHKDARAVLEILDGDRPIEDGVLRQCHFFEDDHLTTEQAHHLFEELHGYGEKIKNASFKFAIAFAYATFIAKRCNFDEINEMLEMLNSKYNLEGKLNPMALFSPIIKQDNKVLLQKVFNLLSEKYTEQRLLLTLAASFLEEDKIAQARKVLATPGLVADMFVLKSFICEPWVKQDKTDVLEKFYSIVQDVSMVDKSALLFQIFKSLCNRSNDAEVDVDKCVEFFETRFEEECVVVDRRMLRFYANFLTKHGREVHFAVDDENESSRQKRTPKKQNERLEKQPEEKLTKNEQIEEIASDDALMKKEEIASDEPLVDALMKKDYGEALKRMHDLSKEDIDTLLSPQKLHSQKDDFVQYLIANGHPDEILNLPMKVPAQRASYAQALLQSGQMDRLVQELKDNKDKCFLSRRDLELLHEKYPEYVDSYVATCCDVSSEAPGSISELYSYYLTKERFDDAFKIQKSFLKELPTFSVYEKATKKLYAENKVDALEKLLSMYEHQILRKITLKSLLRWYANNLDLDSVASLDRIDSVLLKEEMNKANVPGIDGILKKLESAYKKHNRPVPWNTEPKAPETTSETVQDV